MELPPIYSRENMATTPNPTAQSQTSGSSATIQRGADGFNGQDGKYSVQQFNYPLDLIGQGSNSNTSNPNQSTVSNYSSYVVFFINVTSQSKVAKAGGDIVVGTVDKADQNTLQNGGGASIAEFATVAGVAGAEVGAATNAALGLGGASSAFMKGGSLIGRSARAVGALSKNIGQGALAGGAVGFLQSGATAMALDALGIQATTEIKRLKTAIALHVPNNYVVGYRVNYADEELGTMFGTAASAAKGSGATGTDAALMGLAGKSQGMPALSALTKAALNPRKEQLFRSVDNRRFTFEYQFAPRSEAEAKNIKRIINTFKYHMHPEYLDNSSKLAYLFPSEFDIVHMFNNKESEHMNKISTCVLAEMTVNYSPNGQFSTHTDGFPTQINVQLTFIELETLTKERFMDEKDLLNGSDKAIF